ncbi:MAG: OmpA family protein [Salibacteraceae bacterium]|nr:OmpA family protein [Salibacteraceae bacterium]
MRKLALSTLSILAVSQIANAQLNADLFRLNFPSTKSYEQGKPLLSPNGDELFFVSSYRAGDEKVVSQNIWKTSWNDKISALEPQMVKDLSNNDNNAIIGFDTKTNEAYLLGTYSRKENLKKGLSTASISDDKFSKPSESKIKALMIKGDLYDFHKPNNSDVIFMALPNSKDLISIYVSFPNEKNGWSKPVILSQISNEANTEISPYYDEIESCLYFASNRAGGLGGMDIYRSKKQDDSWLNWGTPELLPEPINSKAFDAYYASYGEKGSFLVSTRQDSLSSIYHIKYKEEVAAPEITLDDDFNLEGTNEGIFEYNNLPNANATLRLYDLDGNLVEETITNENGEFVFKKLDPDKKYLIKYLTEDGNFDPSKATISAFDKSKFSALKPITAAMQKDGMTDSELISGVFKYDKLPKPGVEVVLLDEDGNVLSRTLTDANGYYEFSNLDPDKVYLVKYLDEDGTLDPSKLGVFPAKEAFDNGIYSTLKPITANMRKNGLEEGEMTSGSFIYKAIPKEGIEVFLLDEDGKILNSTFTDKNGFYEFKNLDLDKIYLVKYKDADGIFDPSMLGVYPAETKTEIAETPAQKPVTTPVKPEKPVTVETPQMPKAAEPANLNLVVNFASGAIDPMSKEWIAVKEQLLGLDKGIRIRLNGHADNVGSEASNQKLALERAQKTKDMMVLLGFDPALITVNSAGETNPIASNDTEEGRAKNRRVEIKIQ